MRRSADARTENVSRYIAQRALPANGEALYAVVHGVLYTNKLPLCSAFSELIGGLLISAGLLQQPVAAAQCGRACVLRGRRRLTLTLTLR